MKGPAQIREIPGYSLTRGGRVSLLFVIKGRNLDLPFLKGKKIKSDERNLQIISFHWSISLLIHLHKKTQV